MDTPRSLTLFVAAFFFAACGVGAEAQPDPERSATSRVDELFISTSTVWQTNDIPVCWLNPISGDASLRDAVRQKVASSWSAVSRARFTSWGACYPGFQGIRIAVRDEGPHTNGLGAQLATQSEGMVLNFTFKNWETSCQSDVKGCVEKIAVHEFGHALGFAHEQNRGDTPLTCTSMPQGSNGDVAYGAWDLNSVMNYCSPTWNNGGQLTDTDRDGVQWAYRSNGRPGALRTYTGHYVVAEGSGGGVVNANRTAIGLWENFNWVDLGPGLVALQAINGQYVVAEGGGGGTVNANRNAIGEWERFQIVPMGPNKFAFRAANGRFLRAQGGGGGGLRADGVAAGIYETFTFMPL